MTVGAEKMNRLNTAIDIVTDAHYLVEEDRLLSLSPEQIDPDFYSG